MDICRNVFDMMAIDDVGERAWFFDRKYNALFEIDLSTMEMQFIDIVILKPMETINLFINILYASGKVILVPFCSEELVIYDVEGKQLRRYPLENKDDYFFVSAIKDEKVFMLGTYSYKIMELNLKDETIHYSNSLENVFGKLTGKESVGHMFFGNSGVLLGKYWYITHSITNNVIKIDLETYDIELFQIAKLGTGIRSICYHDDYFWLTDWNNLVIYKWNEKQGIVAVYKCPYCMSEEYHSSAIIWDSSLWVFPTIGGHIFKLNTDRNEWEEVTFDKERLSVKNYDGHEYPFALVRGTKLYTFSGYSLCLIMYNFTTGKVTRHSFSFDRNKVFWKTLAKGNLVFCENSEMNLRHFISCLRCE